VAETTSRGWRRNLYLLLVSNSLSMLGLNFTLPFMPLYIRSLGIANAEEAAFWGGVALAAGGISLFIFGPIWGSVADLVGKKAMVVRAAVGGGFSVGALGLAPSMPWVVFIRSFEGVFSGNTGAGQAMVAAIAPRDRLAQSMGLLQVATFTGMALGPLVGGAIADIMGFKPTYFVMGGLMMAGGIFVWRFAKEERPSARPSTVLSPLKLISSLADVLRSRDAVTMLGFFLFAQVAAGVINPVLPLFLQTVKGDDQGISSIFGTALFITGAVGAATALVAGRLSQRIGLKPLILFGCMGYFVVYLLQASSTTVFQFMVLTALTGACRGSLQTATISLIGLTVPRSRVGSAFGIAQSIGSASLGVAPFIGGALASLFGLRFVFLFAAASFLLLAPAAAIGLKEAGIEPRPSPSQA